MIKINEIFFSIQGESSYVGWPTVFVRTTGCNLRCHYCDTKYSYYEGEFLSEQQILEKVLSHNPKYVCVTGGEPLLQKNILPLMTKLCDLNLFVSLETSGSKSLVGVDPRVKIILDVKTPDSGENGSFLEKNLEELETKTEFKFVICSEKDFHWSIEFCRQHHLFEKFAVLFSPSWGQIDARWLAESILTKKLPIRLQLQQHKYIWSEDQRGV
jgi:7-carboxy-7-deazaguanine synthase